MPPKQHYTREDILDAAFSLVREEGLPSLSVRKIAERLGCSTAPVYTYCRDMEEVREAVMEKALDLLLAYSDKSYTDDVFLNVGVGLLVYARENPLLYRELFLSGNRFSHMLRRFNEIRIGTIRSEPVAGLLGPGKLQAIYDKLAVFSNGLAAMVCAGLLTDTSDAFFIKALWEAGADFMGSTVFRSGHTDFLNAWLNDPKYQAIQYDFKLDIK
jgi:AcrR family transcriptional regulator